MFFLTLLEHTIRIPPQSLNVPLMQAITAELQNLFVDKVIKDLGLCISVYDIRSLEGGFVFPGDGAPTFTIDFRLVMFRPFVGEVLVGKLKKSDKRGIYLSLGFFDDIHIPEHLLQQPSAFNEEENLWMWNYQGSELFMDLDEEVRFRVAQLKYPPIPVEQDNDSQPFAPMEIIDTCLLYGKEIGFIYFCGSVPFNSSAEYDPPGSSEGDINADGLGLVSWWS